MQKQKEYDKKPEETLPKLFDDKAMKAAIERADKVAEAVTQEMNKKKTKVRQICFCMDWGCPEGHFYDVEVDEDNPEQILKVLRLST